MKSTHSAAGVARSCGLALLIPLLCFGTMTALPAGLEAASYRGIPRYELLRLLPLPGDQFAEGSGVNNDEVVVGTSLNWDSGASHPVLWPKSGPPQLLGSFGGEHGSAEAVNESGQVVGFSETIDGMPVGFLWTKGAMQRLEPLPGGSTSQAVDINSEGLVAGNSTLPSADGKAGYSHAMVWRNGMPTDLGTLGGEESRARAINDSGSVVGASSTSQDLDGDGNEDWYGFVWREGRMERLPPLPHHTSSDASDIDNRGDVIGSSFYRHPRRDENVCVLVRWRNGVPRRVLPSRRERSVSGVVNESGTIAETSGNGQDHLDVAVLKAGSRARLARRLKGERHFVPRRAADINDSGVIVGWGELGYADVMDPHGYMARPIR